MFHVRAVAWVVPLALLGLLLPQDILRSAMLNDCQKKRAQLLAESEQPCNEAKHTHYWARCDELLSEYEHMTCSSQHPIVQGTKLTCKKNSAAIWESQFSYKGRKLIGFWEVTFTWVDVDGNKLQLKYVDEPKPPLKEFTVQSTNVSFKHMERVEVDVRLRGPDISKDFHESKPCEVAF